MYIMVMDENRRELLWGIGIATYLVNLTVDAPSSITSSMASRVYK